MSTRLRANLLDKSDALSLVKERSLTTLSARPPLVVHRAPRHVGPRRPPSCVLLFHDDTLAWSTLTAAWLNNRQQMKTLPDWKRMFFSSRMINTHLFIWLGSLNASRKKEAMKIWSHGGETSAIVLVFSIITAPNLLSSSQSPTLWISNLLFEVGGQLVVILMLSIILSAVPIHSYPNFRNSSICISSFCSQHLHLCVSVCLTPGHL